ncbi:imidazolonepropionase-like domain-containing protein [Streptomyces sp. NPDC093984]|uniref:imidazolonepropionase-like domain-containing protein n=1 Tax=Streptomyces sp. NPDC093984 TaxID=3366052 RepID=UPI003825E861
MLTLHVADLVVTGDARPSVPEGALLVDGRELAALGTYEELAAAHPTARVRRWPGLLAPGLLNPYGPELLEQTYHPDPREADELGTEPLSGAALEALALSDARWGASARHGVQRMLAHGTVAVAGDLWRPAVVAAVYRAGLTVEQRFGAPTGPPCLDPLTGRSLEEAIVLPLPRVGMDATFAVFDAPDDAALAERGAGTCVATVIAGRLVHRRR